KELRVVVQAHRLGRPQHDVLSERKVEAGDHRARREDQEAEDPGGYEQPGSARLRAPQPAAPAAPAARRTLTAGASGRAPRWAPGRVDARAFAYSSHALSSAAWASCCAWSRAC